MRKRNSLYLLIPIIIVLLILILGVSFLVIKNKPEKIFKTAINSVFGLFEEQEEQISTMKGTMNITANIESDNEQIQSINTMLEGTSINLDMQADTDNMIINENINVTFNNESLLNAAILLQDQKGYIYLKDYLDKYLEIPSEDMEYSDLTEYYEKMETLDQKALMNAVKNELTEAITSQELVQENTTLLLDGQETKVTASIFSLKNEGIESFTKEFLIDLKGNKNFLTALGDYKEDVILMLDERLNETEGTTYQEFEINQEIRLTIYTKGLLNEFVGVSAETTLDSITRGFDLLKHNKQKYELKTYRTHGENIRVDGVTMVVENNSKNKNTGTMTITLTAGEEQLVILYNYEKQGKQTSFVLSTEIEGVILSFSGNATEDGKNVKGNFMISVQEETLGRANLNCVYDFTYGVQIEKVDTRECSID